MDDSETSFGLALYDGDGLARARQWVHMDESTRRRTAMEACRDRDFSVLGDLLETYLRLYGSAGQHLSAHTLKAYLSALRIMLAALKGANLLHLDRNEVAIWIRDMEANGKSASTIQQRLAAARTLYKALRWCRAVDHDPFADIKPARDKTPPEEKRFPYPDETVERLIAVAEPQDKALVLLGAHAGLRAGEILDLTWGHVDLDARKLVVRCGKGRRRRTVPLSRTLTDALATMPRTGEYVISSYRSTDQARHRMEHLCEKAGCRYQALHSLRHTAGTRLYEATGRLEDPQKLLGHQSISTTQIYARYSDQRAKNALSDW